VGIPDLSCVGLIQTAARQELAELRQLLRSNLQLLRSSPLGLLSLILDHRSQLCETWLKDLWLSTLDIETFTGKIPKFWNSSTDAKRLKELSDPEARHTYILRVHSETCNAKSAVQFGSQLVGLCADAIDVVDDAVATAGGRRMTLSARAALEDHNRLSESCYRSLATRALELLSRQKIQLNCVRDCPVHCANEMQY
jgi:hypothetical protein